MEESLRAPGREESTDRAREAHACLRLWDGRTRPRRAERRLRKGLGRRLAGGLRAGSDRTFRGRLKPGGQTHERRSPHKCGCDPEAGRGPRSSDRSCWPLPWLTDSRKRISYEHVDDSRAPVAGSHENGAGGLLSDFADHDCFFSTWYFVQRIKSGVQIFRRDDGEELSFIGDMQRVEAQQLASAADGVVDGNQVLGNLHAEGAIAG